MRGIGLKFTFEKSPISFERIKTKITRFLLKKEPHNSGVYNLQQTSH